MRLIASLPVLVLLAACQRETPPAQTVPAPAPATTVAAGTAPEAQRPAAPALQPAPAIAANATPSSLCNLEGIGEASFGAEPLPVNVANPILLRGWAGLPEDKSAPTAVVVRFESAGDFSKAWEVSMPVGDRRDDVVKANNGAAGLAAAGFSGPVDLSALAPGAYRAFLTVSNGDQTYFCDNGRKVDVQSASQ